MSATGVSVDIVRELQAICGEAFVTDGTAAPAIFHAQSGTPGELVKPGSADEVAAVLRMANLRGLTVCPAGGNTNQAFGRRHPADIVLDTSRLTEIEHYDHSDLTVGVGAGMTVTQLNTLVGADHLLFPLDPAMPERTTIGGVLAAGSHGPLRHGYGSLRDFCIGVRFVTADGRKAKGGGRVVKNVAGYDLMKLLIGSYGTLAVITSASFKLFPAPRQTRTFLAEFHTWQEALKFRDLVVHSPLAPMCLEIVSPQARKMLRPEMSEDAWVICVRGAGSDAVLARYRKEFGGAITRELEGEAETQMWAAIANFPYSGVHDAPASPLQVLHPTHLMAPPSEMPRILEAAVKCHRSGEIGCAFIGRIGLGHLLLYSWPIHAEAHWSPSFIADELLKSVPNLSKITVDSLPNPWSTAPAHLPSMRAVKQALDPNNILRGRELF